MLFNSLNYIVFLPIVFIIYWFVFEKKLVAQNILIVVASYLFYGLWDWRFLFLILVSTLVDYTIGISIDKEKNVKKRKFLLYISVFFNLTLLGIFKYFNFFIDNWIYLWDSLGFTMHRNTIIIILPVGISFYTFQTLSYTIDVYLKKIRPTKDFISFAGFVSFFPQLVAGPIEKASNLLPQFYEKRIFNYKLAVSGIKLIIWGLFKKVVIADNCAIYVDEIFTNYHLYSSSTLLLGTFYFAFQIYGDFSGYSDMAIGTARLLGFRLMQNFNYPYFSRDIAEFWRRWHISLSNWFRDYVYIPIGGSRGKKAQQIRNIIVIFLISGFWHGANWTFIIWGALNALFIIPLVILDNNRKHLDTISKNKIFPTLKESIQMLTTFVLITIAWIFFRSASVSKALDFINQIFNNITYKQSYYLDKIERFSFEIVFLIFIFIAFEWIYRKNETPFEGKFNIMNEVIIISMLLIFGIYTKASSFIYFQF